MYIHGYYYAVISTSQVYVEALGKLLCELNSLVPAKNDTLKDWEKRAKAKLILDVTLGAVQEIYGRRNDFHHLNKILNTNAPKLRHMAITCLKKINAIEIDVFNHRFEDGKLVPTNPKYWPVNPSDNAQVECFVRNIP